MKERPPPPAVVPAVLAVLFEIVQLRIEMLYLAVVVTKARPPPLVLAMLPSKVEVFSD